MKAVSTVSTTLCNLVGKCECVRFLLEDQNTPEMCGLRQSYQSRLVINRAPLIRAKNKPQEKPRFEVGTT